MTGRVDVHQHMVPEVYARWLRSHGVEDPGGRQLPEWSPDGALDLMDRQGIATAILSVSTPGVYLGDGADASRMARQVNECAAEVLSAHPERFGFFATLTLPDVSAAVAEAACALDDLAADGVVLLANSSGVYLGDPAFDPLLAALDERVPRIRFILAHGGGFVPYAAHRLAVTIFSETGRDPNQVLDDLRGFYFDTALTSSPDSLPSLLAFAEPGHVLYGSDWPFAPESAVAYFTTWADDAQIDRRSALALFPRLKETPDA